MKVNGEPSEYNLKGKVGAKMGYMDDHFKEGDTCTGCCTNWITLGIVFLTLSTVEYKVLIGGGIHGIGETHKHQD